MMFLSTSHDVLRAHDIDPVRHRGVKFTGFEAACSRTVQQTLELVLVPDPLNAFGIFNVTCNDPVAAKWPHGFLTEADYLIAMERTKMMERIVAGNTGNSCDEHR